MYYVLNTGSELGGAQKGRNIQMVSWSLLSETLLSQDAKQLERWKVCRLHSTISNYCSSKQHCSPLKPVSLSALSIFLGQDPGNGWRNGNFWGRCSPEWPPASSLGSWLLTAPALRLCLQRTRPALPGAGEGLGILLSRERMLLCLMFNAALAPGGCRQICLLDRLCKLDFLRVKTCIPKWKDFCRNGSISCIGLWLLRANRATQVCLIGFSASA